MAWAAAILVIVAITAIPQSSAVDKHSIQKARSFVSQTVEKNEMDPMLALSSEHREAFAQDPGPISDVIRQLTEVTIQQSIEVRLVGFDGDGGSRLHISDAALVKHLRALRADMDTVALEPHPTLMPVFPEFTFKVTHAGTNLLQRINAALAQAVANDNARPDRLPGEQLRVPHRSVDDVLRTDQHRDTAAALTIYLLAPSGVGDASGKYAYAYDAEHNKRAPCAGSHWVGAQRYMWVDIAAGPVLYGPGMGHEGQVFQHTMPHPLNYKPSMLPTAIVPDLAALVWSAVQHHVWPPLQHGQARFARTLAVEVIHMHDTLSPPADKLAEGEIQSVLSAALGGLQSVTVHESWVSFATCDLCVAAYSSALRTRTARDRSTPVVIAHEARFLDTAALHAALGLYADGIYGAGGLEFSGGEDDARHVLPVFVFDVSDSDEPLLLSDGQQAAAFPDMVLAVTSRVGEMHTHFTCSWDRIRVSTLDITRQVLAAVLTSAWGVANTSTFYTPATGPGQNHLWSVGATPYGPLASTLHLPAPLAALLPRNLALSTLNATTSRIVRVLQGFDALTQSGRIDKALASDWYRGVLTRVNLAQYKVTQAAVALSAVDYAKALRYARSLEHDASSLEKLAVKVSRELKPQLQCASGPGLRTFAWAPLVAVAMWPVARWLRRKMYKPKLEKMW
uniref:DUF7906 domain-containing protein n=1 Tax=Chlamydomonas leiostraca TaxID=1034604 RepID=A0A7S0RHP8_9CHLO|mmetsp:Transcript_22862/g.58264  ORF Transcript_22862/g.58264 Transcript_22862/m.58264 type:complete len:679 (+) Transcript_22862:121-2157(+)|eukprot:CAMPEP_0202881182 /NCGR_PEP_ID=MMETSP1391-20130828/36176_1 /ASSEMBLY_ACC=CAM_ASM_000867 /TAXON_ID=1034604 /ORGANISM="Chlamydomonas leiostraca, Strain SAG 11-49" /LENGTH=678 /DNA_ID=CAMNT_0049563833 /DNA_START=54 /DNA_END=2090 /DNA_ORIENTATION=-